MQKLALKMGFGLVALSCFASLGFAANTAVADNAEVQITNLKNGDVVSSPVLVKFGATNVALEPAGEAKPNSGHHHLLIDTALSAEEMKFAIAKDDQHLHFGKAQTEATIELKPGKHTLQLVLGDGGHELHKRPIMSQVITIEVK